MEPETVKSRVESLRRQIAQHDYRYYVLSDPQIADAEYDALLRELESLEAENPELRTEDSPTQRVGTDLVQGGRQVRHRQPMLSLANSYDRDDVLEWYQRLLTYLKVGELESPLVVEPKLDGVAVEVIYENGLYAGASTRGDGQVGEDISAQVKTIRSLPLRLHEGSDTPRYLEVRGEVVMTRTAFAGLRRRQMDAGEEPYANARNTVAGSLKQLDPRVTATRPLDIWIHGLGENDFQVHSHGDILDRLEGLGLRTLRPWTVIGSLEEVLHAREELLQNRERIDIDIDGVVIKVSELGLRDRLGTRSRSPRWAIAYKFPAQQGTTRLEGIEVQVGRTGALTPVALLEPVDVGGVTIRHASLHNRDEIERLDARPGDTVLVERAGDVIPKVVKVIKSKRPKNTEAWIFPDRCPVCDHEAYVDEEEVVIRCPNSSCPAQLKERVRHYVGRGALDIEGMGEKLIEQLVDRELVQSLSDLYDLDEQKLIQLERMGKKSANNLLVQLESSKTPPLPRFLFGLGIRQVGSHVAEVLAKHYPTLDALEEASHEELTDIHEIGPKVATSLRSFLEDPSNRELLARLREKGVAPKPIEVSSDQGDLQDKVFLFTGTLGTMSRSEAEKIVKERGAKIASSVSKKLTYLVCGEKPGSKLKKAQAAGIEVLDEETFLREYAPDRLS